HGDRPITIALPLVADPIIDSMMTAEQKSALAGVVTAAAILGFFLFFIWPSFRLYFDQDDMYNLYFAWTKPATQLLRENLFFWQGAPRPLGQLFYRCIFALAGFHPLPFRIVGVILCAVNLGL